MQAIHTWCLKPRAIVGTLSTSSIYTYRITHTYTHLTILHSRTQAMFIHGVSGLEQLLGCSRPTTDTKGIAALCVCILCSYGDGNIDVCATSKQRRDAALCALVQNVFRSSQVLLMHISFVHRYEPCTCIEALCMHTSLVHV